jgi:hypothetical protein
MRVIKEIKAKIEHERAEAEAALAAKENGPIGP